MAFVSVSTADAVASTDNHLYFCGEVTASSCQSLIRDLQQMIHDLRQEVKRRSVRRNPDPIWLHVTSDGGDLMAGLGALDQLAALQHPIYALAEGYVASAGVLLMLPCRRRAITPRSYLLIHQLSTVVRGTHSEFEDEVRLQAELMQHLRAVYMKYTQIDAERLEALLRRDSWLNAQESLKLGFVHAVLGKETI